MQDPTPLPATLDPSPTGLGWTELRGDLLLASSDAVAHCVSADLKMGAGIALQFRRRYGRPPHNAPVGGVIWQEVDASFGFIFHLVTKERFWQKPTLETLWRCLQQLRAYVVEWELASLSLPLLGCGLDRLQWEEVRQLVWTALRNTGIHVTIYRL
jgi:O-acetyl-ADP-ribose deacetylase (regulator of RNase III)